MPVYTDEQRAEALRVYVEEGPDIASRQTEISVRTIYRWASAEGVATTAIAERTYAATTAAKARAVLNRSELRALLWEQAVKALHGMDEEVPKVVTVIEGRTRSESYEMVPADPRDKKDLALTAAVLIDKARLEGGEATERMESWTNDHADHERGIAAAIREELARRAGQRTEKDAEPTAVVGTGTPGADSPAG